MSNHGGKREGAGPKALPEGQRRKMISVRLSPEVLAYLGTCENKTEEIESAITRSQRFRTWRKAKR